MWKVVCCFCGVFWLLANVAFVHARDLSGLEAEYIIEVSFSDFTLALLDNKGSVVFIAPVALPRQTPKLPVEGVLTAIERDPWWFPTPNIRAEVLKKEKRVLPTRVPPGPGNPMGAAKLSFLFFTPGADQLSRVHGTTVPDSIATRASHGCIRMFDGDALVLCDLLEPLFRRGTIIGVRYVEGSEDVIAAGDR